jgi:hypothetical protein
MNLLYPPMSATPIASNPTLIGSGIGSVVILSLNGSAKTFPAASASTSPFPVT